MKKKVNYMSKHNKLAIIMPLLMLLVGLSCIGYYFYDCYTTNESILATSAAVHAKEQLQDPNKKSKCPPDKVTYDPSGVDQISPEAIRRIAEKMTNPYYREAVKANAIGALSIPDSGLQVTILKGLSEVNLVSGAGTFWEEQKMGKGNYPLASHNVNNEDLLLGPLFRTKPGMKAYLTDYQKIYIYKIKSVALYSPSRSDLVDLYKPRPTLTLITCGSFNDTSERCVGIGYLLDTIDYESASSDIKNSFE